MKKTALLLFLCACTDTQDSADTQDTAEEATDAVLTLSSPDFEDGDDMPDAFTCSRDGGGDLSPSLIFSGVPAEATSLALTMHYHPDPDGGGPPNHYWLLWDLSPELTGLSADNPESYGNEGANKDNVGTGYSPPCSPSADVSHTYTLTLYALSGDPELPDEDDLTIDYEALTAAIGDVTLESATLSAVN